MRWIVSVKGILARDGAVLVGLNDRGEWELPGGQLEAGETPEQAVVRELAEETGLEVQVGDLAHVAPLEVIPGKVVLIVAYACHLCGGAEVTISDEHRELAWLSPVQLDGRPFPGVYREAIERVVTGVRL